MYQPQLRATGSVSPFRRWFNDTNGWGWLIYISSIVCTGYQMQTLLYTFYFPLIALFDTASTFTISRWRSTNSYCCLLFLFIILYRWLWGWIRPRWMPLQFLGDWFFPRSCHPLSSILQESSLFLSDLDLQSSSSFFADTCSCSLAVALLSSPFFILYIA